MALLLMHCPFKESNVVTLDSMSNPSIYSNKQSFSNRAVRYVSVMIIRLLVRIDMVYISKTVDGIVEVFLIKDCCTHKQPLPNPNEELSSKNPLLEINFFCQCVCRQTTEFNASVW